jgi:integrase
MKVSQRGMGSVFLRPGSKHYWLSYYVRIDGKSKRIREATSFTKKGDATALLRKRTGQIADGRFVEPGVQKTTRLSDLEKLVTANYVNNGFRSMVSLRAHFKRLYAHFGDALVGQIGTAQVEQFKAVSLERYQRSSVNRALAALQRGFRLARQSGLIATQPTIEMLSGENVRRGFLEHDDFRRLVDSLPERYRDPVTFLYLAGWRKGEMKSLRWGDVNLPDALITLRAENSKNKHPRKLALAGELLQIVRRAHSNRRLGCDFVFHHRGRPIGDFRKAWRAACRIAKVGEIIPHDLRRCGVRNLSRAGVPQAVAMAQTGHRTVSTFLRYNITSEADMRDAAAKLNDYLARQTG